MDIYREHAKYFIEELPYLEKPYSKRNWGSKWHSLCSYHGKLKPSIAHLLVKTFTSKGDIVLDPLSGVGTIPFEACLQGRIGMGNDLSKLAYVVSKAKLNIPDRKEVDKIVEKLDIYIKDNWDKYDTYDLPYSNFGYNKTLIQYYESTTFKEIILSRDFFKKDPDISESEAVVMSSLLHVLHGNRPYALSRNSHPLTPYAPSGDFVYKNVIKHINNKLDIVYKDIPQDFTKGEMLFGDALNLHKKLDRKVDAIITSPPFASSIKFYTHNWLRLWFSGWEEEDFKNAESTFLDSLQKTNLDIYKDFFYMANNVIKDGGKMILHLGKSNKCDMAKELTSYAKQYFDVIFIGNEDVSNREKHGVKDKGGTTHHQFMFLHKR